MDAPNLRPMIRPFDPLDAKAEDQYDAVVSRANRVRAQRARVQARFDVLEAQWLDNILVVQSGPKRGEALTRVGRRRRLEQLVELGRQKQRLEDEEAFIQKTLDSMNAALDRWARETYGA